MRRLAVGALLVVLAACGGQSAAPVAPGPPVSELRVGLLDFEFQLSATTLHTGEVSVIVTNAGSTAHDVALAQDGREIGRSDVLSPGAGQTFDIEVAAGGPVRLECTVPGHAQAGMRASVAVAAD